MDFKWLSIPSGESQVQAVETWTVRWTSRFGAYHHETQSEAEVFTDAASAKAFATALKDAFKVVKHTSGNSVLVTKN